MRASLRAAWLVLPLLLLGACSGGREPLPWLDAGLKREMLAWLQAHPASPEQYVVSKFADHDIVFLGEFHRIRHDPLLVQALIPLLYRSGVRDLGVEFALASDQPMIDSLLAAPVYDEALAKRIVWDQWPWWGYQEYVDIFRAAWRLNQGLPSDAPPFRVLGLNARSDFSYLRRDQDWQDSLIMKKVRPEGQADSIMALTIQREVLAKGAKALVYSGIYHAFTRFHEPGPPDAMGHPRGFRTDRMGNRIYALIGAQCCTIFLHAPWEAANGAADALVYPADGMIDALFQRLPADKRRVGFDVAGSPFGGLPGQQSYFGRAVPGFRTDMFCDGWIYQMPFRQYEGVHVVSGWFDEQNRLQAVAQMLNLDPRARDTTRTVESLTKALAADTEIPRRFAMLE